MYLQKDQYLNIEVKQYFAEKIMIYYRVNKKLKQMKSEDYPVLF